MNVVDSSGWLEYFLDGPNASVFAGPLRESAALIVPTITVYEVYKRVRNTLGKPAAIRAAADMRLGLSVEVNEEIALEAAELSIATHLPMADSIILATARLYGATLWTQDADFAGMDGVEYVEAG